MLTCDIIWFIAQISYKYIILGSPEEKQVIKFRKNGWWIHVLTMNEKINHLEYNNLLFLNACYSATKLKPVHMMTRK